MNTSIRYIPTNSEDTMDCKIYQGAPRRSISWLDNMRRWFEATSTDLFLSKRRREMSGKNLKRPILSCRKTRVHEEGEEEKIILLFALSNPKETSDVYTFFQYSWKGLRTSTIVNRRIQQYEIIVAILKISFVFHAYTWRFSIPFSCLNIRATMTARIIIVAVFLSRIIRNRTKHSTALLFQTFEL